MYKIAHRGLSGLYPENTLIAFEKALELDFKGIEFDVIRMRCGTLAVFHDYNTDRLLSVDVCINDLTLVDANKLTLSGKKIPTLKDVLELIGNKKEIHLEIKDNDIYQLVANELNEQIKNGLNPENIIVSSFFHKNVLKIKELVKDIKTGCLIESVPITLSKVAMDCRADYLNVGLEFITKDLVEHAHSKGLKVLVWTVDKQRDFDKMKSIYVDGVFSNFFDLEIN